MKDIIKDFIISMLVGLSLHQTASITQKMPAGYEQIIGTSVGVIGTLPMFGMWLKRVAGIKNPHTWAMSAYLLAFLGVGTGVVLGWFGDTIFHIDRRRIVAPNDTEDK